MDNNNVENVENNIVALTDLTKQLEDLQAELNSYKTENVSILEPMQQMRDENAHLKEMNYTFARHFNAEQTVDDIETQLFNMFGKRGD